MPTIQPPRAGPPRRPLKADTPIRTGVTVSFSRRMSRVWPATAPSTRITGSGCAGRAGEPSSHAEIGALDVSRGEQLGGRPRQGDRARLEDVGASGGVKGGQGVLLDQQDGSRLPVDLPAHVGD